jgi:hypothetical protein
MGDLIQTGKLLDGSEWYIEFEGYCDGEPIWYFQLTGINKDLLFAEPYICNFFHKDHNHVWTDAEGRYTRYNFGSDPLYPNLSQLLEGYDWSEYFKKDEILSKMNSCPGNLAYL